METLWYCLYWAMISTFVVLGGTDIGVGILHTFLGKNDPERSQIIRSIQPVWKPNEVWLVASGGTMFLAFPKLLAVALSGFYLAFMMILWLLVGRGLGIEYRGRLQDSMWRQFCDVAFAASSWVLAICLGAALGNFIRGVPLNDEGYFFEALWTNFRVDNQTGILDWFTLLIGSIALLALAHQGALWLMAFTDGPVHDRAARLVPRLWVALVLVLIPGVVASYLLQPQIAANAAAHPWGTAFPLLAICSLIACGLMRMRRRPFTAFLFSCTTLYSLLASVAFGIYPYLLPARQASLGLMATAAAAPQSSLQLALCWWIPGMLLVGGYFAYVYSYLPKKVSLGDI